MKKTFVITILSLALLLLLQGCGIAKGCGRAAGSVLEGVGYIGTGIKEDMDEATGNKALK